MAPYAKGQSGNPAGRRPGTPNRITAVVREAVLAAFDEVGGKDYLVEVARNEPKVFCALLARLVPTQVRAEPASGPASGPPPLPGPYLTESLLIGPCEKAA